MNQGIHILDVLIMFLASPMEIFAHGASLGHRNLEVEDTISLSVEFAGGVVAGVLATTAAYPGLTTRLHITGTRESGVIENGRLTYFIELAPMNASPISACTEAVINPPSSPTLGGWC